MTPEFQHTFYLNLQDISTSFPLTGKGYNDKTPDSFMAVPCVMNKGKSEVRVVHKGQCPNEDAYYAYSDKFTAAYLVSVFNSHLGGRFLWGTVGSKPQSVSLSEADLTKVPIFDASCESQQELGQLQLWIQNISDWEKDHPDSLRALPDRSRLMLDLFEDIRDGLILELYFSEIFEQRGIRLWEAWAELLSRHPKLVDMERVRMVFDDAINLSSPVRKSLKSIQVLRNSPNFKF